MKGERILPDYSDNTRGNLRSISVLVAGRVALCAAVCRILDRCPDIEVVGSAEDAVDAVSNVILLEPDLVLLDVRLLLSDEDYITRELKARAAGCKVVVCGEDESDSHKLTRLSGYDGYVTLASRQFLAEAVRAAIKGGMWLDPQLSREYVSRRPPEIELPRLDLPGGKSQKVMKRLDSLFADSMKVARPSDSYDGFGSSLGAERPEEIAAIERKISSAAMSAGLFTTRDDVPVGKPHVRRRRHYNLPGHVTAFLLVTAAACALLFFLFGTGSPDSQGGVQAPAADSDVTVIRYHGTTYIPYPVYYPQNGGGGGSPGVGPVPGAAAPAPPAAPGP